MHRKIVTVVIVVVVLLGLGLTMHLINGPGGPGFAQVLRRLVHGN